MSSLSVIIVNYRSGDSLRACLESIVQSAAGHEFEIFVVNNDSVQDLRPVSDRSWPNTQIIQNASNLGLSVAANRAFQQSKAEFVLLLNPDIRAELNSVGSLLETMKAHPEAGMVLPQLRNTEGGLQYSCRRFYTYPTLLLRRGPWKHLFTDHPLVKYHLMQDWDHQSLAAVDWGLGAAMLVRRQAVRESTLFDERFFLYFEDVDLCLRMRRNGWKVLYSSAAVMIHEHRRDSARPLSLLAKRRHFSSLLKFLWKYRFRLDVQSATSSNSNLKRDSAATVVSQEASEQ
jgi:N-acetylglucosaminyl-diphospho-decaprenol L-rhamnosyltransferase